MARSPLTTITNDLIKDSGSVLWSLVKGEQLEYPVTLEFLPDLNAGYIFEAVVVEGLNEPEQKSPPKRHRPSGVQTTLGTRLPVNRGAWDPPQAYNSGEIVKFDGQNYRLRYGIARISSITPDQDPSWEKVGGGVLYLQFPETLAMNWTVQPTVDSHVYGFFELRVTQPPGLAFRSTWKPVRGLVEIHFSPTDIVPD